MIHLDRNERLLAGAVAALAGYVDAIGFIELGGFFVSFMSGNSTRMAVGLAQGTSEALGAAGLIGAFVTGVVAGTLISETARARRRPIILLVVAGLLALAGMLSGLGQTTAATLAMAAAMGAINAVLDHSGDIRVALTYMTGTLVKFGQRLARALLGRMSTGWLPYFLQWLALVAGAVAGGLIYIQLGMAALWPAVAASALLAALTLRRSFAG